MSSLFSCVQIEDKRLLSHTDDLLGEINYNTIGRIYLNFYGLVIIIVHVMIDQPN